MELSFPTLPFFCMSKGQKTQCAGCMGRGCVGTDTQCINKSKIVTIVVLFFSCVLLCLLSPLYFSSSFSFPSTLTYLVSLYLPVAFSPIIFFAFSPSSPLSLPSLSFAPSDLLPLFHFHSSFTLFLHVRHPTPTLYFLTHSFSPSFHLPIYTFFHFSATLTGMHFIYLHTACHLCDRDIPIRSWALKQCKHSGFIHYWLILDQPLTYEIPRIHQKKCN